MIIKVLIVDDEPAYGTLLSRVLARNSCDVRVAADAHSGIAIASTYRPDVVVADWMLRDFHDGLDLLYALRQAGIDCPVIMMSGYPSDQLRVEATQSGVFRFMAKPFEPQEMASAVMEAAASAPGRIAPGEVLPKIPRDPAGPVDYDAGDLPAQ